MNTPLYGIYVDHPVKGWIRVGPIYPNKKLAQDWRGFVKRAWHCPVKVIHCASLIGGAA